MGTRIASLLLLIAVVNLTHAQNYLGPTPYTSFNNPISGTNISPFSTTTFNYFHIENFEDGLFNVPGVAIREFATVGVTTAFSDSVDGDDGTIDGFATGTTRSLFSNFSTSSFTFDFSSSVLGTLPTHAGIVWTDIGTNGGGNPTASDRINNTFFEAFGPTGLSLGVQGPFSLGDNVINRTTGEDRFFGAINLQGISAIRISMPGKNNWEVDHLQYGSVNSIPASTVVTRATRYIGATGGSALTLLATDKVALLPGQTSTFANYTNYSRGLNGIVVDVNGLPPGTTNAQMLSSLQFARWNGIDAGGFVALPGTVVPTVAIAAGGGAGGSARVTVMFADNAVQNTWLRVTVLSNANTRLAANDVFYFGNVLGELDFGNTATRLQVNGQDAALILANQSPGANSATITNKFDLNRDGRVNGLDYAFLLANQQAAGIVAPITAP